MSRVVVIGSINMDIIAKAEHLPVPSETVIGYALNFLPGGKGANQAVAASRTGAVTHMVGALGNDDSAQTLLSFLSADDIQTDLVKRTTGSSGTALITVDPEGENLITMIPGANDAVDAAAIAGAKLGQGDVVLLDNEIPSPTVELAIAAAHTAGATVVLNPSPFKPLPPELLSQIDYFMVNEVEFVAFGHLPRDLMTPERFTDELKNGLPEPKNIIITLGADGLVARLQGEIQRIPAYKVKAVDSTGAGDCFCGAFGASLAGGTPPLEALKFANAAAAISVTTPGAAPSMPHRDVVEKFIISPHKVQSWVREPDKKS
jgi:ribokinase